ncbi:MAG: N-6 DNA methylase, partial [Dehalococcoidia bacterium]|nr:N-6 DNA methylase [Dehalococcoidia bacterium]
ETKRFGMIPPSSQRTGDRTTEEKQAFRYARGKKITYAILTNFERLHVFNADHERLIYAFDRLQDYLDNFEALWRLSPEEVKRGSLPWWEGQLEKKDVDLEFLAALRRWRLKLANAIHDHNAANPVLQKGDTFDFQRLMEVVQRLLDRLIIVRYGDDKEVLLTHDLLDSMLAGYRNRGAYARPDHLLRDFIALSRMMDEHHNTSLFAPGHACEQIVLPNEPLAQVIEEMNRISFRKFTSDILGNTYESYLGTKLSLRQGEIQDEERRDIRKGRGIYYTPRWVVEYIVDHTLGRRLIELEEEHNLRAIEMVRGLAVVDPACGSGSFLIYAYQVLADFYRRLNQAILDEQTRLVADLAAPDMFERLERLKHLPQPVLDFPQVILEEHLFGVDLDPEAAEIAAVNLTMQVFGDSRHKKLPLILNQNVNVGNSLISGGEGELKSYFGEAWPDKRPFKWESEFPEIMARGGFDVVVGNPPYVRIQGLPENERDYFRDHFETSFGSFDLYILFIEQATRLLKKGGRFGFITSGKFLKSIYGQKLRQHIHRDCTLDQLIDLSALQVFGGATTYPILLMFHKEREEKPFYYALLRKEPETGKGSLGDPSDLVEHLASQDALLNGIWPPDGERQPLMQKLSARAVSLGEIAERIFQGLVTSADKVYFVERRELLPDGNLRVLCRANGKTYELEPDLFHPLLKGSLHMRRYCFQTSNLLVLFPYHGYSGQYELIGHARFEKQWSRTWQYLMDNRQALEDREGGKMRHDGWYGYVYPKNLNSFDRPKILTPSIARNASYSYDSQGKYYFVGSGGGGGGGYGIALKPQIKLSPLYVLAVLNSKVSDYYLHGISSPFRGGYFAYSRQFLAPLPIRTIDFGKIAEKEMYGSLVSHVERMIELQARLARAQLATSATNDIQNEISRTDSEIDSLVYELYGLTEEERRIVGAANK